MSLYYDTEAAGYKLVTEFETTEPCYSFNTTVIWYDFETRKYLWYSDSGCSCYGFGDEAELHDLSRGSFHDAMRAIRTTVVSDGFGVTDRDKAVAQLLAFDSEIQ